MSTYLAYRAHQEDGRVLSRLETLPLHPHLSIHLGCPGGVAGGGDRRTSGGGEEPACLS